MSRRQTSELGGSAMLRIINREHITSFELWAYYYGIGGNLAELEIEAFLFSLTDIPTLELTVLAHAVFELLAE